MLLEVLVNSKLLGLAAMADDQAGSSRQPYPWEKFLYGGVSNAIAAVTTNPTDVLKVRLQLQNELGQQPQAPAPAPALAPVQTSLNDVIKANLQKQPAPKQPVPKPPVMTPSMTFPSAGRAVVSATAQQPSMSASAPAGSRAMASAIGTSEPMGLARMAVHMVKTEGMSGLMRGWQPSVLREMSYSAIRMGLYDPMKEVLGGADDKYNFPLWKKVVAGGVAGGVGAAIANPTGTYYKQQSRIANASHHYLCCN